MTDENQFKRVEWTDDGWQPSDDDDADGMPLMPPRGPGLSDADLELLTQAAKAIGARAELVEGEQWVALHYADGRIEHGWNPLRHSDDTVNLSAALCIGIDHSKFCVHARDDHGNDLARADIVGVDRAAAIRLAITRAAAEIGKGIA